MEYKELNDGLVIPSLGFGTYQVKGSEGVNALISAFHQGYRLFDTAYNYENEGSVGQAIQRSGIAREQWLITSKLPGRYQTHDLALEAIQESLYRARLDYFDIYLIHWPNPLEDHYVEAFQTLIEAKRWGLIRSIGVSNFLPEHIERLEAETGVCPSINQIECHPFFNQKDQIAYHRTKNIITEAWSPIGRSSDLLKNPLLLDLARKHEKSVTQIILRWHIQAGTVPIPKSTNPGRQLENISVFDFALDDQDMNSINALSRPDGRLKGQDPATYQEF